MILIRIKDIKNKDNYFKFIKEIVREEPVLFDVSKIKNIDLKKIDVAVFHFNVFEYILENDVENFDINKKDIKDIFKKVLEDINTIYKTNKDIPHFIMFPELKLNESNYIEKLITDINIFYRTTIKREMSNIILPNCLALISYQYVPFKLINKIFLKKIKRENE